MRTAPAARNSFLSGETVEKYISDSYQELENETDDTRDLEGIDLDLMNREERAYARYTALPKMKPQKDDEK